MYLKITYCISSFIINSLYSAIIINFVIINAYTVWPWFNRLTLHLQALQWDYLKRYVSPLGVWVLLKLECAIFASKLQCQFWSGGVLPKRIQRAPELCNRASPWWWSWHGKRTWDDPIRFAVSRRRWWHPCVYATSRRLYILLWSGTTRRRRIPPAVHACLFLTRWCAACSCSWFTPCRPCFYCQLISASAHSKISQTGYAGEVFPQVIWLTILDLFLMSWWQTFVYV